MPSGFFSISDPFGFSAAFLSAGHLFPGSGLSIDGNPASGNLWVNLSKNTYPKIQGSQKLVIDRRVLDKASAVNFSRFFIAKSNAAQIPWILGPMSAIPFVGNAITLVTSTVDGLQRLSQPPINSDQLAVLMSDGGAFVRTIAEEPATRLTASIFYTVKIGNEVRMYIICSATYGLNLTA